MLGPGDTFNQAALLEPTSPSRVVEDHTTSEQNNSHQTIAEISTFSCPSFNSS